MKKIRINELARELEVKPHRIIELLPELGVSEKKTHSSSIDEDVAEIVRQRLGGLGDHPGVLDALSASNAVVEVEEPELTGKDHEAVPRPEASGPEEQAEEPGPETAAEEPVAPAPVQQASRPRPIRPPLAGAGARPEISAEEGQPAAPPPAVETPLGAPRSTATEPPPPVPRQAPSIPVAPVGQKAGAIPAKPLPAPRPGQILTGPRQPFPGEAGPVPGMPRPSAPPRPPVSRPAAPPSGQPWPPQARPRPAATPQTPPLSRPPLAGQPAARPVVPPDPKLIERIRAQQQTQPKAMPGQPQARPPMPGRPQTTPVPGQPIYRGPIRPGQALVQRPGGPGARPGGGRRPMHPTSPMGIPPSPLPPDQQRRDTGKRARVVQRDRESELEGKMFQPRRHKQEGPPPIDREITISEGITVKELSEKLGVKANLVIKKLVEKKVFATINQALDPKLAEDVAREFGASINKVSYEEEATQGLVQSEDEKDLTRRAPVVTIMGHVDHGKTSLLDAIRATNVAEREAGGITQHIGAYQIVKNDRKIVFIDTPGHEAFTRMRARGAKVTDIVVLVVAADDGVMPQTLEAIDHARAAEVPIVVAINKIDKPDAQPERIKQQLSDRGLLPEDWGGETVMVPVSAKSQQNLDLLLEMILLVADMEDLKANPQRPAVGTVLEAQLDRGRGPVATVLVQNGTLHVGDFFICGAVFGKVRAMFSDVGQQLKDAEPSTPVEVLGLDSVPDVGDTFQVVTDTAKAKQIVLYRESKAREQSMLKAPKLTLDQLHEQLREGETKELPIILKADVGGTAEVVADTLQKLSNEKVKVRVLHSGVGAINESDVLLASASNAVIVGFNVRAERNATSLAEQEKVDVRLHTIIYELTDEIKRAMTGMLEPVFKEVYRGRAEVREVFRITKVGTVAGCMVLDGTITRDSQVRLLRDNIVVHTGKLESLRRFKNDVSEVKSGFECGIALANFGDLKPGDIIEAFVTERVAVQVSA
ncbi:MAG TPA: translation initiation factor IF-2 [Bryobacteraceae bacterium]|nr:translation initiation factor IF-2 [Bryobacteraceae bacterium]